MFAYLIAISGALLTAVLIVWLHRSQEHSRQEIADRSAPLPELAQQDLPELQTRPAAEPITTQADDSVGDTPAPDSGFEASEKASKKAELTITQSASLGKRLDNQAPLLPPESYLDETTPPARGLAGASEPANENNPDNWLEQVKALREYGDHESALALSAAHFPRVQALQQAAVILRQQLRSALENRQPVEPLFTELYNLAVLADLYRSSNPDKPPQLPDFTVQETTARQRYQLLGHNRLKLLNKSDVKALEQLWGEPSSHLHSEQLFQQQARPV